MLGAGLVELARRYVSLSDELEVVRGEIARTVLNGAGRTENPSLPPERHRPSRPLALWS
jgi:hypothetical protein